MRDPNTPRRATAAPQWADSRYSRALSAVLAEIASGMESQALGPRTPPATRRAAHKAARELDKQARQLKERLER